MAEQEKRVRTRERLLEVAAEIFAQHGFRNARSRDICKGAGANIAAVNYHFGDKQRLYDEVLRFAFFSLTGPRPTDWGVSHDAPVHERLHGFVTTILTQLFGEGRSALYARLTAREAIDPTHALDHVIEEGIQPQVDELLIIVKEVLGDGASDGLARRCTGSILGQCLFYYLMREIIVRVSLENELSKNTIPSLSEHITRFSVLALRAISGGDAEGE